ncbi:hypothetical protein PAMC26577_25015 [Caballeronia sordidicola]|uniref:Uncharacterized protein n=1 Tax=Caballeronia sordidicola TaxID=196367 RepID=A0A242MIR6_CABSO|nr:hypothetical protein PAMC26577_25015 [Caballeronia sordidicola]
MTKMPASSGYLTIKGRDVSGYAVCVSYGSVGVFQSKNVRSNRIVSIYKIIGVKGIGVMCAFVDQCFYF